MYRYGKAYSVINSLSLILKPLGSVRDEIESSCWKIEKSNLELMVCERYSLRAEGARELMKSELVIVFLKKKVRYVISFICRFFLTRRVLK